MITPGADGSLLVRGIGSLVAVPRGPLCGAAMSELPTIRDAAIVMENGRLAWFGPQRDLPTGAAALPALDARGGCVIPGLIDCHTHIPFAGDRVDEFVRRVAGESYLSIMQAGGGIRVTMRAVRSASEPQLVEQALPRLRRMLAGGVTTVECKSGYGLTADDELKQLRAIRALADLVPQRLVPTYMGAHALPPEYDGRADAFLDHIASDDLLATIAREKLARFCDVFCDRGAFDVPQARRVLERGLRHGLVPKLHADELAQIGASALAGELRAASADHLEHLDDAGMDALRRGGVTAVVLPGTSFFLGIPHADARRMIRSGLTVALATDCNPGSCMIESLAFILHIAVCQLRMLPNEALAACTANAAAALRLQDEVGAIERGLAADLVVLDCTRLDDWFYTPGRDRVRVVIRAGRVVHESPTH
ncbi:MAG: imidazolonepropionase [Planctomycetia bacterium]|nr:MAG: imidazolonepropionase [Planctomycetia bacterium]